MRIAILSTIELYPWAGTEEVWAQFAKVALFEGHEVAVAAHYLVAESERCRELAALGLQIISRRPFKPTRAYLVKEIIFSDMRALHTFAPDVILINSGSLYDVLNLPYLHSFLSRLNVPKVLYCHFVADTLRIGQAAVLRQFLEQMQGVVFVSEHNRRLAQRQAAMHFSNAHVIMNASRIKVDKPLPMPVYDQIHLACVARFETLWKGHDVLLEVLAAPEWKDRNWHLNLYGSGPDEGYIRELITHFNLDSRVSIHGQVSDIQEVWRVNHLMVLASRGEGTPLAVLEAMMCGRPVVTTDVGGNTEILEDGKSGWIAEVATKNSFSKALARAMLKRDEWTNFGYNAYLKATELATYSPDEKLLNLIMKLKS